MDKNLLDVFTNEIFDLIEKYTESGLSVGEVIGAFEIVKMETYLNQRNVIDDFDEDDE